MPERVVLLAVDGLDWSRLRAGIAAGRLPTFARLLERSAYGEVPVRTSIPGLAGAEEGMNSPTLWTTIATGQYYFQHGIYDFCNAMESIEHPPIVESRHVRSPRIWDILTHADLSSVVVGYYVTHPAYPIRGVMVSDFFGEVEGGPAVWPPARQDELAQRLGADDYAGYRQANRAIGTEAGVRQASPAGADREAVRTQTADVLRRFTRLEEVEVHALADGGGDSAQRRMLEYRLVYPFVRDERFHRLFLGLIETEAWRFATVYYRLVDFVSHGFWVDGRDVPADFACGYGPVVDEAYAWIDQCVGQVCAKLEAGDRLMIASDHGFTAAPDARGLRQDEAIWEADYGQHAEPAVLIVSGGATTGRIAEVSLLDITPTVLDFLGLPQAETFDGGPVPGLLSRDVPRDLEPVPAYPYSPPAGGSGLTEREQDMVMKRLAALGYVE